MKRLLAKAILAVALAATVYVVFSADLQQSIKYSADSKVHSQKLENTCKRTSDMPKDYRLDNYRAPTPACVPHGITLDTPQLQQLIAKQQPLLIDVLSVMRRPETDFSGAWLPNKERWSLPNSVWLPNIGYGYLDNEMQHYLRSQLKALSKNDKNKPLVFFCIADCWMSWNALQRAHSYGYHHLYWYKNGTDGWIEANLKLEKIVPIPLNLKE